MLLLPNLDVATTRAEAAEFYRNDAAARSAIERAWQEAIDAASVSTMDLAVDDAFDRMLMRAFAGDSVDRITGIVPLSRVTSLPNTVYD